MQKIITSLALLLFSITVAFSQSKTDDIKALFELMDTEKTINATTDNMISIFKQQGLMQFNSDEDKEEMDAYMDYMTKKVKEMTMGLLNDMVPIYDKHFTHDEIKGLIDFYSTPIGKKLLEKTPELTQDMMNLSMTKYMPEIQKSMLEKLEEMK